MLRRSIALGSRPSMYSYRSGRLSHTHILVLYERCSSTSRTGKRGSEAKADRGTDAYYRVNPDQSIRRAEYAPIALPTVRGPLHLIHHLDHQQRKACWHDIDLKPHRLQ